MMMILVVTVLVAVVMLLLLLLLVIVVNVLQIFHGVEKCLLSLASSVTNPLSSIKLI